MHVSSPAQSASSLPGKWPALRRFCLQDPKAPLRVPLLHLYFRSLLFSVSTNKQTSYGRHFGSRPSTGAISFAQLVFLYVPPTFHDPGLVWNAGGGGKRGVGLEISQLTISQQNATAPTLRLPNRKKNFLTKYFPLSQQSVLALPHPSAPPPPLCQTCFWKKPPRSRKPGSNSAPTWFYLSKYSAERIAIHSYQLHSSADRSSSAFVSPLLVPPFFFFFLIPERMMPTQRRTLMTFLLNSFCIAHALSSTSEG